MIILYLQLMISRTILVYIQRPSTGIKLISYTPLRSKSIRILNFRPAELEAVYKEVLILLNTIVF